MKGGAVRILIRKSEIDEPLGRVIMNSKQRGVGVSTWGWKELMRTYGLPECRATNRLLLLPLHGVVADDARAENVDLPLGKQGLAGDERAAWVLERIGEEEAENESAENRKAAHKHE